MSAPVLSLDAPEAGARCPRCGAALEVVGFCGACEWRAEGPGHYYAAGLVADVADQSAGRSLFDLEIHYDRRPCIACGTNARLNDDHECRACAGEGTSDEEVRAANARAGARARAEQEARGRLDFLRGEKWAAK